MFQQRLVSALAEALTGLQALSQLAILAIHFEQGQSRLLQRLGFLTHSFRRWEGGDLQPF